MYIYIYVYNTKCQILFLYIVYIYIYIIYTYDLMFVVLCSKHICSFLIHWGKDLWVAHGDPLIVIRPVTGSLF